MKRYKITVGGRTFIVKLLSDPRQSTVRVEVDGQLIDVQVQSADTEPPTTASKATVPTATTSDSAGSAPTDSTAAEPRVVRAPLPGIIKSIAVRPGEQVKQNDVLLVIVTMKMDNVIRASRGGTIGAVLVAEGRQVNHGAPLIEFVD